MTLASLMAAFIKTAINVERLGVYIHLSCFSYYAMSTRKNMNLLGTTYDTSISLGFERITSGALQSRCISCVLSILNLAPFVCKIPNPGRQIREIQYHEEPTGAFFLSLRASCVTCSSAIELCSLDFGGITMPFQPRLMD